MSKQIKLRSPLDRDLGHMLIDLYGKGMRFRLIWVAGDGCSIILSPMNFPLTILVEKTEASASDFHCTLQLLFAMKEFGFDTAEEMLKHTREFLHIQMDYVDSKETIDNRGFIEQHQLHGPGGEEIVIENKEVDNG